MQKGVFGLIDVNTGIIEAYIMSQDLTSDCEELTTDDKIHSLVDAAITDGIIENSEYICKMLNVSDVKYAKRI